MIKIESAFRIDVSLLVILFICIRFLCTFELKRMDIQPQRDVFQHLNNGGEVCPRVFCTTGLALSATIKGMQEEGYPINEAILGLLHTESDILTVLEIIL